MVKVYILVGVPGVGKSWVMSQIKHRFICVKHDDFMNRTEDYVDALYDAAQQGNVLGETPFSMSQICGVLESRGVEVVPVIILEDEEVLRDRYFKREGRDIPQGHLTRQRTYLSRSKTHGLFSGTSEEVARYLKNIELED